MTYGYVRVSSLTQNIDRQLVEMRKQDIPEENIFIDKQSGSTFERTNYQKLKKLLKKDDLVIVKSIDRLGRNYDMIIQEWKDITKTIKCNIFVLDMPLLDTRAKLNSLMDTFISDVVLQILSFVAQNERENIRIRQAEGIAIAKAKGIHMGRPAFVPDKKFYDTVSDYSNRKITIEEALKNLNISKNTFFKYSQSIKKRKK